MFVLKNAPRMFGHTFRGSTLKNFLGLEDDRDAFKRYKEIRRTERAYI
jgi:anaerobic magnesium-protoporphyrin IX monomethyl ester cyclase